MQAFNAPSCADLKRKKGIIMSTSGFNNAANGGYTNHISVYKDVVAINNKLTALPQLDFNDPDLDEDKLEQFVTDVKKFIQTFVADMSVIEGKVSNSSALDAAVRKGFLQQLGATKAMMMVQSKAMSLTIAELNGEEVSMQDQMALQAQMQAAQMTVLKSQKALAEAIYGFQPGQTLEDVDTGISMTVKDFERYSAMVSYKTDAAEVMQRIMPALQAGDLVSVGHVVDLIDDVYAKQQNMMFAVSTSNSMTSDEKVACNAVAQASQNLLATLKTGLEGLMQGDMQALMTMMQSMQAGAKALIAPQAEYYAVLEKTYAATAGAPAPKAGKGGPKNG